MYVGLSTDFLVEEADAWRDQAWCSACSPNVRIASRNVCLGTGGGMAISSYLATEQIEDVLCGGENYDGARPCHYEWVKSLSDQCSTYNVSFNFIETGTCFVKDGRIYRIYDKQVHFLQAPLTGRKFVWQRDCQASGFFRTHLCTHDI